MEIPDSLEAQGMCRTVKVNRDAGICQNSLHLFTLLSAIGATPCWVATKEEISCWVNDF